VSIVATLPTSTTILAMASLKRISRLHMHEQKLYIVYGCYFSRDHKLESTKKWHFSKFMPLFKNQWIGYAFPMNLIVFLMLVSLSYAGSHSMTSSFHVSSHSPCVLRDLISCRGTATAYHCICHFCDVSLFHA
jgi:hypothetical protein